MNELESLVRRNAESCEQAKHRACRCHCRGKLHGKPHSEEWVQKAMAEIADERWAKTEEAEL